MSSEGDGALYAPCTGSIFAVHSTQFFEGDGGAGEGEALRQVLPCRSGDSKPAPTKPNTRWQLQGGGLGHAATRRLRSEQIGSGGSTSFQPLTSQTKIVVCNRPLRHVRGPAPHVLIRLAVVRHMLRRVCACGPATTKHLVHFSPHYFQN